MILYWVKGNPTPRQLQYATRIGAVIRNAKFSGRDYLEKADYVAGPDVPPAYQGYPRYQKDKK